LGGPEATEIVLVSVLAPTASPHDSDHSIGLTLVLLLGLNIPTIYTIYPKFCVMSLILMSGNHFHITLSPPLPFLLIFTASGPCKTISPSPYMLYYPFLLVLWLLDHFSSHATMTSYCTFLLFAFLGMNCYKYVIGHPLSSTYMHIVLIYTIMHLVCPLFCAGMMYCHCNMIEGSNVCITAQRA